MIKWLLLYGRPPLINLNLDQALFIHKERNLNTSAYIRREVNTIIWASYYPIRNINRDISKTFVYVVIGSRLDYVDAVLYNFSNTLMERLQIVQNSTARLATYTRKGQQITPALNSVHWLSVVYRLQHKILAYSYEALHGTVFRNLLWLIVQQDPRVQNLRPF